MMQPLEFASIDVVLRAEGALVEGVLGTLVDDRALVARKRHAFLVGFEEVLPHLGAYMLKDEPKVCGSRIIAQNCVLALHDVAQPEEGEERKECEEWQEVGDIVRIGVKQRRKTGRAKHGERQKNVARREG